MFTVEHVIAALALACFHRFMEPLENRILLMPVVLQEYVSTDAAGLMRSAPKRTNLFNKHMTNRTYLPEHLPNI